jgi:sugar lactone lactonase YvrE
MGTAAGGFLGDFKPATSACMEYPQFGGIDGLGRIYIADSNGDRIRRIGNNGAITTVAGVGQLGYNGEGIKATTAAMGFPRGLAVDAAGDFWYSDPGNNRVRMVNTSGIVNTVAGNGIRGYSGDGGPATSAEVNQPNGLALDASGNLYFSDAGNNVVRMINGAGIINTVVGNGTAGFSGDAGPATSATLNSPRGLGFDAKGNLYIADLLNARIRIVTGLGTSSPLINTYAGNGAKSVSGDGGPALLAGLGVPRGVLVNKGLLYITVAGPSRVRAVNMSTLVINSVAGSTNGYDGEGNPPLSAQFQAPTGLMADAKGDLLIVDTGNDRVRRVDAAQTSVTTIAGGFVGDNGSPTGACLNSPENIFMDASGNYWIAETDRVRKVSGGIIATAAGTGIYGYTGDGGSAASATLASPLGVAEDPSGNLFIADNWNKVIRKVDTTGTITTFFNDPAGVDFVSLTTDAAGNVYSVDRGECVVRQISPSGVGTIVAGVLGTCGYNSDGIAATAAQLKAPYGVALDSAGNIFIGDAGNNRVRKVTLSTGLISTVAGTGTCNFSGDGGLATAATLCAPSGVVVDPNGRLFIADYFNFRVRLVDTTRKISTYAGTGIPGFNNNGRKATSTNLGGPISVALSPSNILYISDDVNYRIRVIQ